jgi:hypothetical protein
MVLRLRAALWLTWGQPLRLVCNTDDPKQAKDVLQMAPVAEKLKQFLEQALAEAQDKTKVGTKSNGVDTRLVVQKLFDPNWLPLPEVAKMKSYVRYREYHKLEIAVVDKKMSTSDLEWMRDCLGTMAKVALPVAVRFLKEYLEPDGEYCTSQLAKDPERKKRMTGAPASNRRMEQAFAVLDRAATVTPNCSLSTMAALAGAKYNHTSTWVAKKSGLSQEGQWALSRWSVGAGAKEAANKKQKTKDHADHQTETAKQRGQDRDENQKRRAVREEILRARMPREYLVTGAKLLEAVKDDRISETAARSLIADHRNYLLLQGVPQDKMAPLSSGGVKPPMLELAQKFGALMDRVRQQDETLKLTPHLNVVERVSVLKPFRGGKPTAEFARFNKKEMGWRKKLVADAKKVAVKNVEERIKKSTAKTQKKARKSANKKDKAPNTSKAARGNSMHGGSDSESDDDDDEFTPEQMDGWQWPHFNPKRELGKEKTAKGINGEIWTVYSTRDGETLLEIALRKNLDLKTLIRRARETNPMFDDVREEEMADRNLNENSHIVVGWTPKQPSAKKKNNK